MLEPGLVELIGAGGATVIVAGASAFGSVKFWWWRQNANGQRPASSLVVKLIAAHVESMDQKMGELAHDYKNEIQLSREAHERMWVKITDNKASISRIEGKLDR